MATEKEVQSLLLRLSVLLATSLKTLTEPIPPNITSDPSSSKPFSSGSFQSQVLDDIRVLLESIQKACTNLTLALRNDKLDAETLIIAAEFSPTSGLDTSSLEAAAAQLEDLTSNFVPKLTWLSRKASSEAQLSIYVPKTEDDKRGEAEERDRLHSQGGFIVEDSLYRKEEKLERLKGKGVGFAWSRSIKSNVVEIHASLADLTEAFMSSKTKEVLRKASESRAKAEGRRAHPGHDRGEIITMQQARKKALQATAVVWKVCEAALQGKLPKDNREAVIRNWKARSETLQDALRELREAIQDKDDDEIDAADLQVDNDDLQDDFDFPIIALSPEERKRAEEMHDLLRSSCQLYARAGANVLKRDESEIDFDDLDEAGEIFASSVDVLVSSVVYGEEDLASGDGEAEDAADECLREGQITVNRNINALLQAIKHLYAASNGLPSDQIAHFESQCQTLLYH